MANEQMRDELLAALTQLAVDPAEPAWGDQELTAVARPHRGHRLGLLTKVAMLELIAAREPRLAFIQTWNGETNAHMVAINETLGFRVTGRVNDWLLPTAPGAPPTRGRAATSTLAR